MPASRMHLADTRCAIYLYISPSSVKNRDFVRIHDGFTKFDSRSPCPLQQLCRKRELILVVSAQKLLCCRNLAETIIENDVHLD